MGIFSRKQRPEPDAAQTAARGAAVAASTIQTVYGHTVTYGIDDLPYVDRATSDLAATGSIDDKADTLAMFGLLVGEIIVRNDGAEWIALNDAGQRTHGVAFVLKLASGALANPIAAVYKNAQQPSVRSAVDFREQALQH